MELELSGIDGREEILPEKWIEHHRRPDGEDEEGDHEDRCMLQAHFQKPAITEAEFLEVVLKFQLKLNQRVAALLLELVRFVVVLLQQILSHRRHNRAG